MQSCATLSSTWPSHRQFNPNLCKDYSNFLSSYQSILNACRMNLMMCTHESPTEPKLQDPRLENISNVNSRYPNFSKLEFLVRKSFEQQQQQRHKHNPPVCHQYPPVSHLLHPKVGWPAAESGQSWRPNMELKNHELQKRNTLTLNQTSRPNSLRKLKNGWDHSQRSISSNFRTIQPHSALTLTHSNHIAKIAGASHHSQSKKPKNKTSCSTLTSDEIILMRLAKLPNKLGPYVCRLCHVLFQNAIKLAEHRCPCILHMDYRCPECAKVFNCPANLASHRRWHKPNRGTKHATLKSDSFVQGSLSASEVEPRVQYPNSLHSRTNHEQSGLQTGKTRIDSATCYPKSPVLWSVPNLIEPSNSNHNFNSTLNTNLYSFPRNHHHSFKSTFTVQSILNS